MPNSDSLNEATGEKKASFFGPYIDSIDELNIFVELGWAGLGYASVATRAQEILRKVATESQTDLEVENAKIYEDRLRRAAEHERFASEQSNCGFPYLYSIAVIRLWTILETVFSDLVLQLFIEFPNTWGAEVIRKLKGPLVEFAQASLSERAEFLVDLLTQEVKAKLKPGVGRFESVLEAIGFSGPVDDGARRVLLELSQLRNVIVHRDGKADARLVQNCPWLGLSVGEPVRISLPGFHQYTLAVSWYMLELCRRWKLAKPIEEAKKLEEIKPVIEFMDNLARSMGERHKPSLEG